MFIIFLIKYVIIKFLRMLLMIYGATFYDINDITKKKLIKEVEIESENRSNAIDKAQIIADRDYKDTRIFVDIRRLACKS